MVYGDPNQLSRADSLERYYLGEELEGEKKEEETAGVCKSKLVSKLKLAKSGGVRGETTSASSVKEEQQQQQHYCYLCKRGFNSGKALGGHMSSAHVQAGRDYQPKKRLKSGSSDDEDEDGAGGVKRVCGICKKVFPTEKSLHGHMRSHPDRSYRGMNPPRSPSPSPSSKPKKKKQKTSLHQSPNSEEKEVSKDSSSFASSADGGSASSPPSDRDNDHEENKSLDNVQPAVRKIINPPDTPAADASDIPKSGKLSSFSSSDADNQSSSVPLTADEELSDILNSLVSLRNKAKIIKLEICSTFGPNPMPPDGDQTPPPPPPRDHIKLTEVYERNPSNVNIPSIDSDESDNLKDVKISIVGDSERKLEESPQAQGKALLIMEPNNNPNDSPPHSSEEDSEKPTPPPELENQDETYLERRNSGSRKRSRIQKKGKGKILSGAEKEKKNYKCSSCNCVFATHQALGGHMSSHNKISSGRTRFTLQNNNNTASDYNRSSCSPENQSISQPTDSCSPSHQCLICSKIFLSGQALGGHMRCHASQLEPSSSSPQEYNNSSCSKQQKVLNFDLNELPNDDDDDNIA